MAGYWSPQQVNLACNFVQRFSLPVPGQDSVAIQAVFPLARCQQYVFNVLLCFSKNIVMLYHLQHDEPLLHCQHKVDHQHDEQFLGQIGGWKDHHDHDCQFAWKSNPDPQVRATVPIKAGSPLLISRADPLLDMHTRLVGYSFHMSIWHQTCIHHIILAFRSKPFLRQISLQANQSSYFDHHNHYCQLLHNFFSRRATSYFDHHYFQLSHKSSFTFFFFLNQTRQPPSQPDPLHLFAMLRSDRTQIFYLSNGGKSDGHDHYYQRGN